MKSEPHVGGGGGVCPSWREDEIVHEMGEDKEVEELGGLPGGGRKSRRRMGATTGEGKND